MHQPDYLPWSGYFNKIAVSDKFIFFDTAFHSLGGFHNRNKIKTAGGWAYLTIPMPHEENFKRLMDASLPVDTRWASKHWKSMVVHYGRAPYWREYSAFFEQLYANITSFKTLADLNINIIEYLSQVFGFKAQFYRASALGVASELRSTEAILAVIPKVGATEFLAGPSGKKYLKRERFVAEKIELLFQEYHQPEYAQLFPPFVPGLSAVDLLFNEGPRAINFLK